MKTSDIHIRDPFVLVDEGTYYLYGTRGAQAWTNPDGVCGVDVFTSKDLENWEGPFEVFKRPEGFWATQNYWAPEVHCYEGRYYLFISLKSDDHRRATQIFSADTPMGPFTIHSEGPITPEEWECLDGTLHVEKDGTPYMVFCHEWVQIKDGEMCAVELSRDLKRPVGKPWVLFKASQPQWAASVQSDGNYVTDGPFMYRTQEGGLLMTWSSFSKDGYLAAIAKSDDGTIRGQWKHLDEPLFGEDGGHGMIFKTLEGQLIMTLHRPNKTPFERPVFSPIEERDGVLKAL